MNTIESTEKSKELELTIQATNGDLWERERFNEEVKVDNVRDRAVKHFVKEGVMAEGEYDLCRLHDGVAQPPLDPSARLKDAGVHDHDHLVLVPKEPQVDG